MKSSVCDGRSQKAVDCPSRTLTSRNELNSRFRWSYCYKCGSTGHDKIDYKNSSPRTQPTQQRTRECGTGGISTQTRHVTCAMQVS